MIRLGVRDLAVARGGLRAVEGVSFTLSPGQALVLRGPNGIGKTTVLRTLAGLQPAVAGQIEAAPESLAYAGHADGLKPALTVAENLRFWSEVFGGPAIAPRGRRGGWGWRGGWSPGARSGFWMNRRCRWTRPRSRCSRASCATICGRAARR